MTFVPSNPAERARANASSLEFNEIGMAIGSGAAGVHTAIQTARGKAPEPTVIYAPAPATTSIWADPMLYVIGGAALLGGGLLLWISLGDSKPARRRGQRGLEREERSMDEILDEMER